MQKRERTLHLFCQEPFRMFFPVGLLLGAIGVSLWILYYAGITTLYPGVSHARLMIEGFVLGFVTEALWPQLRVAALHIVFITGFGFVILTVATRVILGHSGNAHLFTRRLPFHTVVAALMALAMFSRVTADLAPRARAIHLVAAGFLWLAALLIWTIKLVPKLTVVETED